MKEIKYLKNNNIKELKDIKNNKKNINVRFETARILTNKKEKTDLD